MKTTIYQLGAMMRYEFKMGWRRRLLPILLILAAAGALLSTTAIQSFKDVYMPAAQSADKSAEQSRIEYLQATVSLMISSQINYIVLMGGAVIMFAEIVSRDRQLKTFNLLRSLPFGSGAYLIGKLLGTWATVLAAAAISALITGAAGGLILGAYDFPSYLVYLLVALVPPLLFASGLSMLVTSAQPTRRRAVIVAMLIIPVALYAYVRTLTDLTNISMVLNPSYITMDFPGVTYTQEAVQQGIINTLLQMAAGVALAWFGAWGWMQLREGRV